MDASASSPEAKVRARGELRASFKDLEAQWDNLDKAFQKEARKRRSKFGHQELATRGELKDSIREHIVSLKNETASSGGSATIMGSSGNQLPSFEAFRKDIVEKTKASGGTGEATAKLEVEEISQGQQLRMQMIAEREAREDQALDQIYRGVERIGEQAKAIGEKVLTQGELLQALETDIEAVQEHLDNTNTRLKQIVKEAGEADQFCMNIFCVVMLLGMVGVFLKLRGSASQTDDADGADGADSSGRRLSISPGAWRDEGGSWLEDLHSAELSARALRGLRRALAS